MRRLLVLSASGQGVDALILEVRQQRLQAGELRLRLLLWRVLLQVVEDLSHTLGVRVEEGALCLLLVRERSTRAGQSVRSGVGDIRREWIEQRVEGGLIQRGRGGQAGGSDEEREERWIRQLVVDVLLRCGMLAEMQTTIAVAAALAAM